MPDPITDQQTAGAWLAAAWRCSCGYFTDDQPSFDGHLETAADAVPEHFEVRGGWTLQNVRQWQAATATARGESPQAALTGMPAGYQHPTAAEQAVISAAQTGRGQCVCGEAHPDSEGVTPDEVARMKAYRAANPGHQFAVDDGIVAVIIPRAPEPPEVVAWAGSLACLLDTISAPPAAELS